MNDKLKITLSYSYEQLVPLTAFKGDIILLTQDEFEILKKHVMLTDNDIDIIKISNQIFKCSVEHSRAKKIDNILE